MVQARKIALVTLVSTCVLVLSAPPGSATQDSAIATPGGRTPTIGHPQDDWAGSQIASHEGTGAITTAGATQDGPLGIGAAEDTPAGFDVSSHQGAVNWSGVTGAQFVYVKATESTTYTNPQFEQQYDGSFGVHLIRGAYHFATPDTSDGTDQANFFVNNGGGWTADGATLPPAVDLEYDPYSGNACYNLTPDALAAWIHDFVNTIHSRTGRFPVIYTSTRWWGMCMGGHADFGADPLWIARYNSVVGNLPPGWSTQTFWQFADSGQFPGDQDSFNGDPAALKALAAGTAG